MLRPFPALLIMFALALPLAACDQQIIKSPHANNPRIILNERNVVMWSVTPDGIGIKLTDQGAAELKSLTESNIRKPIDIYVGNILYASPVVSETIGNGQLQLYADSDKVKFDKIIDALPPAARH